MRVLFVIDSLQDDGAARQLARLATALPKADFEVHVAVLSASGPCQAPLATAGVPVHRLDRTWDVDPFAWWQLKELIDRLRPRMVHAWLTPAGTYAATAAPSGATVLVSERTFPSPGNSLTQWLRAIVRPRPSQWLAPTQRLLQACVHSGAAPEHCLHLRDGVVAPDAKEAVAAETTEPGRRFVGAISRFDGGSRLKELIWAADLLKCVRDDVHLLVFADGPQRARFERYRRLVEIEDRVHFEPVAGWSRWLPRLEAFWQADALPRDAGAIPEALAAGVPVVAVKEAAAEFFSPGQGGHAVTRGDRAEFASWTLHLLESPEYAAEMRAAARRRAAAEFSVPRMVAEHADVYRRLAA